MSSGEWPVPPDEQLVEPILDGMTRRHSLYVIGGVTVGTLMGAAGWVANDVETNHYWPDDHTKIQTVRGSRRRLPEAGQVPKSPWVVGSGLGRQSSLEPAEDLAYIALGVPQETAMVGGLYLPNQGISDQENASCMYSYSADGTGINILGHSMGSLTLLRALLLTEQPLHVDNFILVSSPSGLDDVYRKKDVAWAVEHGFDGNFAEELLFNLINDHTSDRPGFLGKMQDIWTRAVHNTETGVSPKVYMDQLRIVYETKLMSMIGELAARGIIDNKTRVIYCKSAQDGTVIADQACNNFARFFTDPRLNANFSVTTFNASHANMPAACKKVAPWCRLDPEYYLQ